MFEEISYISGNEIEKLAIERFEQAGWLVKNENGSKRTMYDLALYDGEKFYGYVEIYKNLRPEIIVKKLMQGKAILDKEPPKIFIFTNLISYYVSYFGKPFEKIYHVPTKEDWPFVAKVLEDFVEVVEKGGNSNGTK